MDTVVEPPAEGVSLKRWHLEAKSKIINELSDCHTTTVLLL